MSITCLSLRLPLQQLTDAQSSVGGSNFAATTSFDILQKSECTSCQGSCYSNARKTTLAEMIRIVTQDLSNYWVPELYFQYGNGSFEAVDGGDILVRPR